jgi:NADH:ubiquinone oxidoreductase subunit C
MFFSLFFFKNFLKNFNYLSFLNYFFFFRFNCLKFLCNFRFTFDFMELIVNQQNIYFILLFLKKSIFIKLNLLVDIIVKDFFTKKNRFQLSYLFLSIKYNFKILISIFINSLKPIFSIICLYKNANWFEREVYDLFGIYFLNHFDLRRLLTDYNFLNFPLRKDFPLSGFFELFYNDTKKKIISTKISFLQEFRLFSLKNN